MKYLITGLMKLSVATILIASLVACGGADERKVKYLEKGKAFFVDKNYDKAKIEIKNVLQIDPKFAEAYFIMGKIEEVNTEYGKAIGYYNKAIELEQNYVEAKIKLSRIYVIAGTFDYIEKAKVLLADVKKAQPGNTQADLILATIDYKLGNKKKAISALEKVVAKNNNLTEGISLLASLYVGNQKISKAIKLLTKGAKHNPKNVQLRLALARLLAKENDLLGAEKYLKETISIDPEKYSLQVALSSFYASSNQLDKAESVLRKAITDDDEEVQRYLVLVEFLSSRISIKKAEEELVKIVKSKPKSYSLKFAQIQFYQKIGKLKEAKVVLKQIISDKSYDVEGVKARNLLAEIFLQEGDISEAKNYIKEVIDEYPNDSDALLVTSKLALIDLDATTAINGLRTIVKNDPKNAEASLLLAQAHELNKESSLAENELKKAIEANPVNDKVHANYARYLASKGRIDEAVDVIDKALTYFKDSYDLMEIKLNIIASQGKGSEVMPLLNMMELAKAGNPEVNILKGKYYLSKTNVSQAIEEFEKAYKKSQNKYVPLQLIVRSYVINKQSEKAIERLQKILNKNKDDAIANLLMGHMFLSKRKIEKAREKYKQASKAAESWIVPYTSLAATYDVEKDSDRIISIYKDALVKLKNKVPAQMQIASIYEKNKNYSAAMKMYEGILSENPGNKLAANNYASLLLDYGVASDITKALELAKSFEKISQPALQDTLAWAYAKAGDNDKAIKILKPIVEKAPKIAVFRYHLGYALNNSGDKAAAKSHLKIAASSEQVFPGKDNAKKLLKSL